jgi:uncharacterized protein YuzE
MKISYDEEADALSITFRETTVTTKLLGEGIAADYDAEGQLAGIGILDAIRRFGGKETLHQVAMSSANVLATSFDRFQAEQKLRESRRRFEDLVESIEGIVWEADAQTFQATFVSHQAERILGFPVALWIGEPHFGFTASIRRIAVG